ncbi:hypothetical protein BDB01DRAFT_796536 [Pilobolus umbonatus]|nr:hypothetical protein BDB01DRAFT_796536 [Pilobolus umbonatus]
MLILTSSPRNKDKQQNSFSLFPFIQEAVNTNDEIPRSRSSSHKCSEIKFKMESVGNHLEKDEDLDKCPARTRPLWPKHIIPWWKASNPTEKSPYSYATIIAHAIFASRDGRLTLNDIYKWVSGNYPGSILGNNGWQNSIRHNLSLNKKWFAKIDRRPTKANPGKGCYWTLIPGTEKMFIDNLTQEGVNNRKNHDIGLTIELSFGQRRGACFYHNHPDKGVAQNKNVTSDVCGLPATQTGVTHMPSLYTTFRMINMYSESVSNSKKRRNVADESDCDSGIDISQDQISPKRCRLSAESDTESPKSQNTPIVEDHCGPEEEIYPFDPLSCPDSSVTPSTISSPCYDSMSMSMQSIYNSSPVMKTHPIIIHSDENEVKNEYYIMNDYDLLSCHSPSFSPNNTTPTTATITTPPTNYHANTLHTTYPSYTHDHYYPFMFSDNFTFS